MNKKIILVGVMVLVLVIFGFIIFNNMKPSEERVNNKEDVSVIDEEMILVDEDETVVDQTIYVVEPLKEIWTFPKGELGDWSIETPYFNPFLNEIAYVSVERENNQEIYLSYIDEYAALVERTIYGDVFRLTKSFDESLNEEENTQLLFDIETYVNSIDGRIVGRYYDSVTFECIDDLNHWIGHVYLDNDGFVFEFVKEFVLPIDTVVTINPSDYEGDVVLTSYNTGYDYQSLYLSKDSGDCYIQVASDSFYGNYWRRYQQHLSFEEYFRNDFYIDNLPYDEGRVQWRIYWDDNPPNKIEIALNTIGAIPYVQHGESLGAIKVSAEHVAFVEVRPTAERQLTINHDEFYLDVNKLDKTPDGDHIIYVPSGLWDVIMHPKGDALVSKYETTMVPVNTGQVTEVVIPNSVSSKLKVTSGFDEKGVSISDIKYDENRVTFRFTLLDEETKLILPSISNTKVSEGGAFGEIIDIKPVEIPPSVVLLLDSSGSMKGQMDATLDAAKVFVESLPEDVKVQIIDFDSTVKLLSGEDKTTVLKSLDKVSVGGATTLYDAIIKGVGLLSEEDRPTLVVFTDGEDANLNDTARGSDATKDEALEIVKIHDVPLFTIGFGDNHDHVTLTDFAAITEGRYYAAKDQDVLNKVFSAINNKIINTYDLTYERPEEMSKSDLPVLSIVVDTSGSMGEVEEGIGERMTNVKYLLHRFVDSLPEHTQLQLTEFNSDTSIVQTLTTDKTLIMRSVARLEGGGSTDIEGSIETSFETLKEVPSSKKIILYITDAALGTTSGSDHLLKTLKSIGESDIQVLWVGMGVDDYESDFIMAADLTGGDYVVTEDVDLLQEKFDEIVKMVMNQPESELVNVHLNIEKVNTVGERESYSSSKLAELPLKKIKEEVIVSEAIQYIYSDVVRQYDEVTSDKITGPSLAGKEVIISNRMKAESKASNEACEIEVKEIFIIDKVDGVTAPSGQRFISLDVSMTNILPEQEVMVYPDNSAHPSAWVAGGAEGKIEVKKITYMIPNFSSHLYLTYNNKDTVPASTATWLMEKPLVVPGNYALTLQPDETKNGILTFIVPDELTDQMSLHFYDTNYGHIDLPIVGIMTHSLEIEELPKIVSTNLSDTFGLAITDYEHVESLSGIEEMDDLSTFKIVEGNFTSNMQALIDINPMERMHMRILTESGDFYIPVNPATVMVPGGFVQPRMMAPGAQNMVKWVFQTPVALEDHQTDLFVELYGDDKWVPIHDGDRLTSKMNHTFEHEYFNITINDLVKIDSYKELDESYVIADVTISDIEDGYSTSGIMSQLSIVTEAYFNTEDGLKVKDEALTSLGNFASNSSSNQTIRYPHYYTEEILLGLTDETVVYDGTSRRGLIIFDVPEDNEADIWSLYSPLVKGLLLPAELGDFNHDLLVNRIVFEEDTWYKEAFQDAIGRVVEQYRLAHPSSDETLVNGTIGLDDPQLSKNDIPVPMISLYGRKLKEEINTVEEMIQVLSGFRVIPSEGNNDPFEYLYSTEAFLIQGFGTEQDFANATIELLSSMGYRVKPLILKLTDRGKEVLKDLSGLQEIYTEQVPGISFVNNIGEEKVLILPFMVYSDDIKDLAHVDVSTEIEHFSDLIQVKISLIGEYTERGMLKQFSDMSDALSGETEPDNSVEIDIFNKSLEMGLLSLDAIDIGVAVSGQTARAYALTAEGEIYGKEIFNPNHYKFDQMNVTFYLTDNRQYTHISEYDEGMTVDQMFLTASINAPDLSSKATEYLQNEAEIVYQLAENPNELSALKWYARNMIAKFISKQSIHDHSLADDLDLIIGRTYQSRVIVVSTKNNKGVIETSFDLVQPFDQIHEGEQSHKQSFNIMTGLYASTLEGQIIENGYGLEDVWAALPSGTEFIYLSDYYTEEMIEGLKNLGVDGQMINYLAATGNYVILPEQPAIINGVERWGWLEMNPNTYETIAVLDDYSKGASVESAIIDAVTSAGKYLVGAFKGVETSVWSVAAFSLEESDYDVILKKAKAFALGLVNNFGVKEGVVGVDIGGTISASQNVGPIKISFDGSFGIGQSVLGFNEGFVEGVKLYFDIAK